MLSDLQYARKLVPIAFGAMLWLGSTGFSQNEITKLLAAKQNHKPLPNISLNEKIDIAGAYDIQTAFVKGQLARDEIAGFKAGLTNPDSQAVLGINRPIFGVLFKSGDFTHKKTISLSNTHYLMLETEIGFITNKPIRQTITSIEELKTYIDQIVPVIEIPDLGFTNISFNAIDLVAGNAGSYGFMVHTGINWFNEDINSISVSLSKDLHILNQGQGIDAMGNQWEALRWLVNQVLAHGWTIEKGHLLITGALGEMIVAKPGHYRAQFNDHAIIDFTIVG